MIPSALADPAAAGFLLGGTLVATLLRSPAGDLRAAWRLVVRRPALDRAGVALARLEQRARDRGLFAIDPALPDPDLDEAARLLAHAPAPDRLAALFASQRGRREDRARAASALFAQAAETAPTLGLIGTVLGLMSLFSSGGSAADGGLATALATTLYGAVLGTLVLDPLAARIAARGEAEEECRRALEARMLALLARSADAPPLRLAA